MIFDAERGRNGGLILEEGKIYRVFKNTVGACMVKAAELQKITNLTEQDYNEETQFLLRPQFSKVVGAYIHLINKMGSLFLIFLSTSKRPPFI